MLVFSLVVHATIFGQFAVRVYPGAHEHVKATHMGS